MFWGEDFNGFMQKSPYPLFKFPQKLVKICFGRRHGLALTTSGVVYSWGDGTFDELASLSIISSSSAAYLDNRSQVSNSLQDIPKKSVPLPIDFF